MEPTMWSAAGDIVTALGSGLSIFTKAPISYVVVAGFVFSGIGMARKMLRKGK